MGIAALVVLDILLVLAVARVLRSVLTRLRQPPVMAEVLAGIVLGASVLGALPGDPSAALFTPDARAVLIVLGEVAVVGYLFRVGAGLDPRLLRREGPAVAAVAGASFVVPWIAGVALALALHDDVRSEPPLAAFALFLGTALAVTAFPVLSRIVDARGLRDRRAGRVALGAAAAQELLVWPVLAVAVALAGRGGGAAATPLGYAAAGVLSLAVVPALARVVVPAVARRWPRATGPVALAALGISAAATELGGLHLVLGAFLFGAALPAGPRDAALALLARDPARLAGAALLPLFFALPALRVDVGALGAAGFAVFGIVLAVAVGTKLASASAAAGLAGLPRREALTIGVLMNARGLVELVVLSVGLSAGLVDERLFAGMVLMALTTTFAAGPLVDYIERRAAAGGARAGATRRAAPAVVD